MTKDNEMILRVLEARLKKNDKEAFDYVSALGYDVDKVGGRYVVSKNGNEYWHKEIAINFRYDRFKDDRDEMQVWREGHCDYKYIKRKDFDKIDFVKILETPVNLDYRDVRMRRYCPKKTDYEAMRDNLRWKKRTVEIVEKNIADLKKQIKIDMDNLEKAIQRKCTAEQMLNEYRKEIGLK